VKARLLYKWLSRICQRHVTRGAIEQPNVKTCLKTSDSMAECSVDTPSSNATARMPRRAKRMTASSQSPIPCHRGGAAECPPLKLHRQSAGWFFPLHTTSSSPVYNFTHQTTANHPNRKQSQPPANPDKLVSPRPSFKTINRSGSEANHAKLFQANCPTVFLNPAESRPA
jgi:hypothetical protein